MALQIHDFVKSAVQPYTRGLDGLPSGEKSTLHLGTDGEITVRKWKTFGSRGREFNESNRATRDALYKALTSELGSLDNLPDSVKKALKLNDFGLRNGKVTSDRPLTMRRIVAIDKAVTAYRKSMEIEKARAETCAAVSDRICRVLANPKVNSIIREGLQKRWGTTSDEVRQNVAEFMRNSPKMDKMLTAGPMGREHLDLCTRLINEGVAKQFRKAVGGKPNNGLYPEAVRCGTAPDFFNRTTINGRKADPEAPYDVSLLTLPEGEKWTSGFDPNKVGDGQNKSFYANMLALVPKENPNRIKILQMVTSMIGLEGPQSALSDLIVANPDIDLGFGNLMELMMDSEVNAPQFLSDPTYEGSRDVSLSDDGKSLVFTQSFKVAPQLTRLDGSPLAFSDEDGTGRPIPVSGCGTEMKTTITISLDDKPLASDQLPRWTCEVSA